MLVHFFQFSLFLPFDLHSSSAASTCFRAAFRVRCERFTARVGWGLYCCCGLLRGEGRKLAKARRGGDPGGRGVYSCTGFDRGAGLIAIMIRPISAQG